jgi:hypothetical protein
MQLQSSNIGTYLSAHESIFLKIGFKNDFISHRDMCDHSSWLHIFRGNLKFDVPQFNFDNIILTFTGERDSTNLFPLIFFSRHNLLAVPRYQNETDFDYTGYILSFFSHIFNTPRFFGPDADFFGYFMVDTFVFRLKQGLVSKTGKIFKMDSNIFLNLETHLLGRVNAHNYDPSRITKNLFKLTVSDLISFSFCSGLVIDDELKKRLDLMLTPLLGSVKILFKTVKFKKLKTYFARFND